jgi:hypothetical protein
LGAILTAKSEGKEGAMHARMTTINGVSNVGDWGTYLKKNVVPEVSQIRGNRELTVSFERAAKLIGLLSVWETEADLQDSQGAIVKLGQESLEKLGGTASLAAFEIVIDEITKPPEPGNALIVRRTTGDPLRVNEGIAFVREEIVPMLKAMPGFRCGRAMVNRKTGEAVADVVYDSLSDLGAAREKAEPPVSARAASLGRDETAEVSVREILFAIRQ